MDAGKAAMPEAFGAKTLELAQHCIDRCAGPSAAVAALLWSMLDFLTIAWEMTGAKGCLPSTSASTTLCLYNTLQPVVRHAIITLAHAPGGWALDSQSQILTTNDLTSFLNKLVLSSGIKELLIALGKPFLGFAKNTHDRWLPTLSYGGIAADSPYLLLATPPLFSFDNIDAFFCTHISVVSWQAYLIRKQPALTCNKVPLTNLITFPGQYPVQPNERIDGKDNNRLDWIASDEAIISLIGWIAREIMTGTVTT